MLSKTFPLSASLVAKFAFVQPLISASKLLPQQLVNIELTNPQMSTPYTSYYVPEMIYPFSDSPVFDWSDTDNSWRTTDTNYGEASWYRADFAGGETHVKFIRVLLSTFQVSYMTGVEVYVGRELCGTFPSGLASRTWYYFECPEGTSGEYVKLQQSEYRYLSLAGLEAYDRDYIVSRSRVVVVTGATLEGTLDTENACADAMGPLGYDTRLIDVDTPSIDDPCTCIKFEDDDATKVAVTYNFAAEFKFSQVHLTNLKDDLYRIEGVKVLVGDVECGTVSTTLGLGEIIPITCIDGPLEGSTLTIEKEYTDDTNKFGFCGVSFQLETETLRTDSEESDSVYLEHMEQMEALENRHSDLEQSYVYMSADYSSKSDNFASLEASYDLLESDYDDLAGLLANTQESTENLEKRIENLGQVYESLTDAYEAAQEKKDALDEVIVQKDSNLESYSEVSTMAEKCAIGPIAGWFWYCREGDALVRKEDAENEAGEEA